MPKWLYQPRRETRQMHARLLQFHSLLSRSLLGMNLTETFQYSTTLKDAVEETIGDLLRAKDFKGNSNVPDAQTVRHHLMPFAKCDDDSLDQLVEVGGPRGVRATPKWDALMRPWAIMMRVAYQSLGHDLECFSMDKTYDPFEFVGTVEGLFIHQLKTTNALSFFVGQQSEMGENTTRRVRRYVDTLHKLGYVDFSLGKDGPISNTRIFSLHESASKMIAFYAGTLYPLLSYTDGIMAERNPKQLEIKLMFGGFSLKMRYVVAELDPISLSTLKEKYQDSQGAFTYIRKAGDPTPLGMAQPDVYILDAREIDDENAIRKIWYVKQQASGVNLLVVASRKDTVERMSNLDRVSTLFDNFYELHKERYPLGLVAKLSGVIGQGRLRDSSPYTDLPWSSQASYNTHGLQFQK